jgi:UDP-N-acetylglucosamine 1-carboxyvinyltransferase
MNTKESFIIEGLAGRKKLRGTVTINGAKNAALKAMAAAVLFDGPIQLENVPNTDDIRTMAEILKKLGAKIIWRDEILEIDASEIETTGIDPELAQSMRASIVLTGPMLGRFGQVSFPMPGGCVIGARPIDLFLEGYEKMGAKVVLKNNLYHIKAAGGPRGMEMVFNKVSVGGTETLMMAAVLAKGKTILKNCAREPEIGNVAEWLNACGARIKGIGTSTIEIEGTGGNLLSAKKSFVTISDRIEAGSFLILGALCAEELTITKCRPEHLKATINILKKSGVQIEVENGKSKSNNENTGTIRVRNDKAGNTFKAFNMRTREYPGFPTDLQAPLVVFLTQAEGESVVLETIFEGRFKYVEDLIKMGADITVMNPREIIVKGPTPLARLPDAEELRAHDIRAGLAIVLSALVGRGKFRVNNVNLIDRGYERLEKKLQALGAKIKRVRD